MEPDDNPSTERVDPQVDAAQFSFTSSWPIGKIAEALAKAQGEMRAAEQDALNPHFGNKYGTIASVMDSVRGPLSANGIAVVQIPQGKTLVSMLVHSSGQFFRGTMDVKPVQDTPQGWGSAWKYARRYSLEALTCATTRHDPEDDDAEEATKPKATSTPKKEAPRPDATGEAPHICEIHKVAFRRYTKKDTGEIWYSHKLEDGKWCSEGKAKAQPTSEPGNMPGNMDDETDPGEAALDDESHRIIDEAFGPAPEATSATEKPKASTAPDISANGILELGKQLGWNSTQVLTRIRQKFTSPSTSLPNFTEQERSDFVSEMLDLIAAKTAA